MLFRARGSVRATGMHWVVGIQHVSMRCTWPVPGQTTSNIQQNQPLSGLNGIRYFPGYSSRM
jgi:hypothetical protein